MSKRTLLIGIGAVLAALLVLYFAALPGELASSYKKKALAEQTKLAGKVAVLSETYNRPVYVKVDTKAADDKNDLAATRTALNQARDQLSGSKSDLTGFVALPLLGVNPKYRDATTASQDMKTYVARAETLFREAAADLDYFDKSVDLEAKYENIGQSLESVGSSDTPESVARKLDEIATQLQTAAQELRALQPPESLKKGQEIDLQLVDKVVPLIRESAAAIRSGDLDKLTALGDQITAAGTDYDNQTNTFIISYSRDSAVQKTARELNVLNLKLEDDFNRF